MSILNNPVPVVSHTPVAVAARLKGQARSTHAFLVKMFNEGAKTFWSNPNATPEQLAAALGTDGEELFKLHGLIGQLLGQVTPNEITEGMSVVGQFSYSEDGRIVLPTTTTTTETTPVS